MSVGLNLSIRVLIRYSNDFGTKVNCELWRVIEATIEFIALICHFFTYWRKNRLYENKKSSGHLTNSPISSFFFAFKTSLVLLWIVYICNSSKHFTNLFVKRVAFFCIPCICNCSAYIELWAPWLQKMSLGSLSQHLRYNLLCYWK